ncbi:MAG TPA: hypothetical protein VN516_04375, partial [Candidatus Baltobacteraceae bacterium]|nr:hypothetical protein [Candidatus Baltobacteraceae bacterium]
LDSATTVTTNVLGSVFGVAGIINCSKGNVEDSSQAKNFIHELKPGQTATLNGVTVFVTSVGGPDGDFPLGQSKLNPWRYVNPGVNNPNGYDLWIQLKIGNKTNLICNWSTRPQINSPLP